MQPETTPFDLMGGEQFFTTLVHRFYQGVAQDPVLMPMYPSSDMEGAERRLTLFLMQYWGGPTTYSDERGHPRLRMRHVEFAVTPDMRDRWLRHMLASLDALGLDEAHDLVLRDYLVRAAHSLVNAPPTRQT